MEARKREELVGRLDTYARVPNLATGLAAQEDVKAGAVASIADMHRAATFCAKQHR